MIEFNEKFNELDMIENIKVKLEYHQFLLEYLIEKFHEISKLIFNTNLL